MPSHLAFNIWGNARKISASSNGAELRTMCISSKKNLRLKACHMSSAQSACFVQSLPDEIRTEMVREWQESLREIEVTVATVEVSLDRDLESACDDSIDIQDRPDFDNLLNSLRELASLRAQRSLFFELLKLADPMSAEKQLN